MEALRESYGSSSDLEDSSPRSKNLCHFSNTKASKHLLPSPVCLLDPPNMDSPPRFKDSRHISKSKASYHLPPPPIDLLKPPNSIEYFQACHETRVRSFPHVEGNYALHVFIPVLLPPAIRKELIPFVRKVASHVPDLHTVDSDIPLRDLCRDDLRLEQVLLGSEFHISLARTVPIRVHQIDSIVSMLRQKLQSQKRYYIDFTKWEVFCNDDQTRTFLSLEVTSAGLAEIRRQILVLDDIYRRHNLPEFYKNPRPHISLVWALGNISHSLKQVTEGFNRYHGNAFSSQKRIFGCTFNGIECKIGKKLYKISRFTDE